MSILPVKHDKEKKKQTYLLKQTGILIDSMSLFLHCFYFRSYQPITKIFLCCPGKKNIGRTLLEMVLESPLEEYEESQQRNAVRNEGFCKHPKKGFKQVRWVFRAQSHSFQGRWCSLTLTGSDLGASSPGRRRRRGGSDWADWTGSSEPWSRFPTAVHSFLSHIMFQKKSFQTHVPFYFKIQKTDAHFFRVIILGVCYWQLLEGRAFY